MTCASSNLKIPQTAPLALSTPQTPRLARTVYRYTASAGLKNTSKFVRSRVLQACPGIRLTDSLPMAAAATESPSVKSKQNHDYARKLRAQLINTWIQHTQENSTRRIKIYAVRYIYVNKTMAKERNTLGY